MTADRCDLDTLVALMQAGDLRALDAMVRCYSDRLVAVGRRCCRTGEEAEEAVQDALLQAGEQLGDYRGEGSPLAWLSAIVANRCRRMRRGQRNDPTRHVPLEEGCRCLLGADSMPTLVAFRDGVEIGREVGFRGRNGLADFLDAQTDTVSMSCGF